MGPYLFAIPSQGDMQKLRINFKYNLFEIYNNSAPLFEIYNNGILRKKPSF